MHTVDEQAALGESRAHAQTLYIGFTLAFLVLLCVFILIWRQASSRNNEQQLRQLQAYNFELTHENHMLKMISDNLSCQVLVLDNNNRITYTNKALEINSGFNELPLTGQKISAVFDSSTVKNLEHVFNERQREDQIIITEENDKTLQATYVPLDDDGKQFSLILTTDISAALENKKQCISTLSLAVSMLTKALEEHDPYTAEHSARVKEVAVHMGNEIGLTDDEIFDLSLSASLMNIGKFYLPREIITKQTELTDEEQEVIKTHIMHTIAMLIGINMDDNIIDNVAQAFERLDGTGYPNNLPADQINKNARLLAVANTFVAMICPRPWRNAMLAREAIDKLFADPGYDRKMVSALNNCVENKDLLNELSF
jgi:HD-GYP domain-containing protein (c-di-GMP phosphodiesterase class II)